MKTANLEGWAPRELFKCIVPEGKQGNAAIERFHVSESDAKSTRLRVMFSGRPGAYVPSGHYTRLLVNGGLMMSDTPKEYQDHRLAVRNVAGDVLIHGLGLGCFLNICLHKPNVKSVTVVEINGDVIELVAPTFAGHRKLRIIHDDALAWKPERGARWDFVWHDIWPDICEDNLADMRKLHRRFGRRCRLQASWSRSELERMRFRGM